MPREVLTVQHDDEQHLTIRSLTMMVGIFDKEARVSLLLESFRTVTL